MAHWRGHKIEYVLDPFLDCKIWIYSADRVPVRSDPDRRCAHCNRNWDGQNTEHKDHDPCIAGLRGVANACCGHGKGQPYVQLNVPEAPRGRISVYGKEAERILRELGGNLPRQARKAPSE